MKITLEKQHILKAMNALQKVSQNKVSSNLPGTVYISTKIDHIELQGNDYDLGIKMTIDATIDEPGTIVIVFKYLQDLLRKLPGDTVQLSIAEGTNQLKITSEDSEYNLVTLPLDSFSLVEHIQDEQSFDIDANELKELIDLTSYAAATEDDRPVFSGALLEVNENNVTMVTTDTHRMAVKKITIQNPPLTKMRSIIPIKTLTEVSRLLPTDNPTMVHIVWNQNYVSFTFDSIYMLSRLIEGSYPDYERVIPSQFDSSATIDRKAFAQAVDRVLVVVQGMNYNVIKYDWQDEIVQLSCENSTIGTGKEMIPITFKGTPFTISFNGRYISDILRHSTGDVIHLFLKQAGPMVIRQDNNPNYTYVVTPIRNS